VRVFQFLVRAVGSILDIRLRRDLIPAEHVTCTFKIGINFIDVVEKRKEELDLSSLLLTLVKYSDFG